MATQCRGSPPALTGAFEVKMYIYTFLSSTRYNDKDLEKIGPCKVVNEVGEGRVNH